MTQTSKPIGWRASALSNQWQEFATQDRARILVWRLEPNEMSVADAFLAMELDERTAELPDVFVELESAFRSATSYGACLCDELADMYRSEQDASSANPLDVGWNAPERIAAETDTSYLVRGCLSFAGHFPASRHLVLALRPCRISDRGAFRAWLVQLATSLPDCVRVLIFDSTDSASWDFEETSHGRIVVRPAALNLGHRDLGPIEIPSDSATLGRRFRALFMELTAALAVDDHVGAEQFGDSALAVSQPQRWFHLSAPIHAMLGSSLTVEGRIEEAKERFLAAEESALRGETEGAPELRETCAKLRLQSRLGLGSALLQGDVYAEAARVFEETAPMAAHRSEPSIELDCYRLAAYSYQRAGLPDTAFRCAFEGFRAARQMPADVLASAGLTLLTATLLYLCEVTGRESMRADLEREIETFESRPVAI